MLITVNDPQQFLKELFFNAYQASRPVGMGRMHYREDATADEVFECVQPHYEGGLYHADYVFGRMMNLTAKVKGNEITLSDSDPSPDYQSWCSKYPTYQSLVDSVSVPVA